MLENFLLLEDLIPGIVFDCLNAFESKCCWKHRATKNAFARAQQHSFSFVIVFFLCGPQQ